jgi:hypothetical protein
MELAQRLGDIFPDTALDDICAAYAAAHRTPSLSALTAIGRTVGKTNREILRRVSDAAEQQGAVLNSLIPVHHN